LTLTQGNSINDIAFSPDGMTLAAGNDGGDIGMWNIGTRQQAATWNQGARVFAVAFSSDGKTFAIGDSNGIIKLLQQSLWKSTDSSLSRLVCNEVRRNMTQDEWAANAQGQPYQKTCPAYP
jgi:WD40 repeat protein